MLPHFTCVPLLPPAVSLRSPSDATLTKALSEKKEEGGTSGENVPNTSAFTTSKSGWKTLTFMSM